MTPQTAETLQPEPVDETPARRPMWELAECACPDFCERDHEQD